MRGDIYRKLKRKELRRNTYGELIWMYQEIQKMQKKNVKTAIGVCIALIIVTSIFIMKGWLWTKINILFLIWCISLILFIPINFLAIRLQNNLRKIEKELKR